ncbi:MAG: hypothetical protein QXJ93_00995 [Candidatus Rehaiarchaeum fermentans]|nr:hypothetical protein [Candidatus Rehaiarchaeum fermentans]
MGGVAHVFEDIGHGIEHVGEEVWHGISHAGEEVWHGISHAGEEVIHYAEPVIHAIAPALPLAATVVIPEIAPASTALVTASAVAQPYTETFLGATELSAIAKQGLSGVLHPGWSSAEAGAIAAAGQAVFNVAEYELNPAYHAQQAVLAAKAAAANPQATGLFTALESNPLYSSEGLDLSTLTNLISPTGVGGTASKVAGTALLAKTVLGSQMPVAEQAALIGASAGQSLGSLGNYIGNTAGNVLSGFGDVLSGAGGIAKTVTTIQQLLSPKPNYVDPYATTDVEGTYQLLNPNAGFSNMNLSTNTTSQVLGQGIALSNIDDLIVIVIIIAIILAIL